MNPDCITTKQLRLKEQQPIGTDRGLYGSIVKLYIWTVHTHYYPWYQTFVCT